MRAAVGCEQAGSAARSACLLVHVLCATCLCTAVLLSWAHFGFMLRSADVATTRQRRPERGCILCSTSVSTSLRIKCAASLSAHAPWQPCCQLRLAWQHDDAHQHSLGKRVSQQALAQAASLNGCERAQEGVSRGERCCRHHREHDVAKEQRTQLRRCKRLQRGDAAPKRRYAAYR